MPDILKNLIRKKGIHYDGDELWSMNASKIVGAGGGACAMSVFLAKPAWLNYFFLT